MIPVVVIFGATASGKTALAESLFSSDPVLPPPTGATGRFRGQAEIISADSMQVYRGLDIGTAKPGERFLSFLPHHLIDIVDPAEQFGAGSFVRLADAACAGIHERGKIPVVLGGTAFYLKNFIYGLPETPEADSATRKALQIRLTTEGIDPLWVELCTVDPESAGRINKNDFYRVIRALEVFLSSGRPLSSFKLPQTPRVQYRFLVIALERPREELNRRIDARVNSMFDAGLPEEIARLVKAGHGPEEPGMQAIGYREFFMDAMGTLDLELIRRAIAHNTKLYAKRQETFFKPLKNVIRLSADDAVGVESLLASFLGT